MTTIRLRLAAFFILASCAPSSRSGSPAPLPEIPVPATPAVESGKTSWTITGKTAERQFLATTTGSIESLAPQVPRRDSLSIAVSFSTSVTRGSPPTYSARLEAAVSGQASSETPFSFSGRIEPGRITIDPPMSPGCSNPAYSAIPTILRSLVVVPSQLSRGMTWTDSTTSSICSGSIPATLTSVRSYRVLGETTLGGEQVLVLEQQTTTRLTGEGAQDQHRVRITGDGSGKGQLHIDLATGGLIDSSLDHTSSITVTASGRDQRFSQRVRETVRRKM